ncbi:MAG: molybdenum cofactor biosynthesis protein MoaE [Candidatus Dormibacteraeota bacterium]|nr:molybdenum cofactor biosynthesis protein MoaE [Candidatus Dormibacteraeota bacterium]
MITARLFARLREQAGRTTEELDLAGASVADVYSALRERHPALEANLSLIQPALNESFAQWTDSVKDGDEIAFIPPVSGGSEGGVLFEVTSEVLDARRLEAAVAHAGAGAICTFTGIVRDNSRGEEVTHLEYEAYAEMAEKQMRVIADEIAERWPEARIAIAHRTGFLEIGEASVVVAVSCPHRAEAIDACRRGIDRLKESVPIWKKEFARSGAVWIEGTQAREAPPAADPRTASGPVGTPDLP